MTNSSTQKDAKNQRRRAIAAVRVSPHGYFGALLVLTFFSALLMYLDAYMAGLLILAVSWLAISALALIQIATPAVAAAVVIGRAVWASPADTASSLLARANASAHSAAVVAGVVTVMMRFLR